MSVNRSDSACAPVAVNRYGRRRSSPGNASTRPCSSSRASAPYSVPGPILIPACSATSCTIAYPCFGPPARLPRISSGGLPQLNWSARRTTATPPLVRHTIEVRGGLPGGAVGRAAEQQVVEGAAGGPDRGVAAGRHGVGEQEEAGAGGGAQADERAETPGGALVPEQRAVPDHAVEPGQADGV